VLKGDTPKAEELLKKGADVNSKNENNKTLLELATSHDMRKLLISYGAKPSRSFYGKIADNKEKQELKNLVKEYEKQKKALEKQLPTLEEQEALKVFLKITNFLINKDNKENKNPNQLNKEEINAVKALVKNETHLNPILIDKICNIADKIFKSKSDLKQPKNNDVLSEVKKEISKLLKSSEQKDYAKSKMNISTHSNLNNKGKSR
jgi:hypothetical protein